MATKKKGNNIELACEVNTDALLSALRSIPSKIVMFCFRSGRLSVCDRRDAFQVEALVSSGLAIAGEQTIRISKTAAIAYLEQFKVVESITLEVGERDKVRGISFRGSLSCVIYAEHNKYDVDYDSWIPEKLNVRTIGSEIARPFFAMVQRAQNQALDVLAKDAATRPAFTGVHVAERELGLYAEATNGHRGVMFALEGASIGVDELIFPEEIMTAISGLDLDLGVGIDYQPGRDLMFFQQANVSVCVRLLGGSFPDIEGIMKASSTAKECVEISKSNALSTIKLVMLFNRERVTIEHHDDNQLHLKAVDPHTSNSVECSIGADVLTSVGVIDLEYSYSAEKPARVSMNTRYLRQALESFDSDDVRISYTPNAAAPIFLSEPTSAIKAVIMPLIN